MILSDICGKIRIFHLIFERPEFLNSSPIKKGFPRLRRMRSASERVMAPAGWTDATRLHYWYYVEFQRSLNFLKFVQLYRTSVKRPPPPRCEAYNDAWRSPLDDALSEPSQGVYPFAHESFATKQSSCPPLLPSAPTANLFVASLSCSTY